MEIDRHTLIKTCDACPAQWDGRTVNGYPFYIRYRHGGFRVELAPKEAPTLDEEESLEKGGRYSVYRDEPGFFDKSVEILYLNIGGFDGFMEEPEMLRIWSDNLGNKDEQELLALARFGALEDEDAESG